MIPDGDQMSASCPHCRAILKLKAVKPGRFAANCPHCAESVIVVVPDNPDGAVSVLKAAPQPVALKEAAALPDTIRFPMHKSNGEPIG